jgi:hypothetical protein
MKMKIQSANPTANPAGPAGGNQVIAKTLKRALVMAGIACTAAASTGCVVVHDDATHQHYRWWWHHEGPPPPPP